jgi:hypothetical protein
VRFVGVTILLLLQKLLYLAKVFLRLTLNQCDEKLHWHQNKCDQHDVTRSMLITLEHN